MTEFTTPWEVGLSTVRPVTEAGLPEAHIDQSSRASPLSRARRLGRALPRLGGEAVAIANGLFGDALDERDSALATQMTLRAGGETLPLRRGVTRDELVERVPDASPRICVLVHGLMSTESIWRFPRDASTTYGTLLAAEHGTSVLSLRYNTGRHISTNGRELAHLLQLLLRAWPVRVREINLVGHSMGGLVIRSACHYARSEPPIGRRFRIGRRWTSKVRRVVLIGVPNDGAGLEAFVNSTSATLEALPLSPARLLGRGLEQRSAGIKDLRFGAIHDEDWVEQDSRTDRRVHPHRPHRLRGADHLIIAGTITSDPEHPIARRIGDALVTSSSAAGMVSEGELFPGANIQVFPKLTHNTLAHHPDVYDAIANWW